MQTTTQPVGFIRFHGMTLLAVEFNGKEYVNARSFADLAGIDWRNGRTALLREENVRLYGTKELSDPVFAFSNRRSNPSEAPESEDIITQKTVLCIELERARMYLARIDTARMRAHGKEEAAEKLLKLQIEWAKVLHDYETQGIAVKSKRKTAIADLFGLVKAREKATPEEKRWLTLLIEEQARELGIPDEMLKDPQRNLELSGGAA